VHALTPSAAVGVVPRAEVLGWVRGPATSGMSQATTVKSSESPSSCRAPLATVERPVVQEDKRWAGAGLPVGDAQPSDLDLVRGALPSPESRVAESNLISTPDVTRAERGRNS
jgi:hypothetical protein